MIPRLRPNQHYYRVRLVVCANEKVLVQYNKKLEWYWVKEDLEVPEYYLTKEQYCKLYESLKDYHIKAALREHIAYNVLGHEKYELNEDGSINEETWEWIPGYINPKDFMMLTMPHCKIDVIEFNTDEKGVLLITSERRNM